MQKLSLFATNIYIRVLWKVLNVALREEPELNIFVGATLPLLIKREQLILAQSAGAVEYTDWTSAEG